MSGSTVRTVEAGRTSFLLREESGPSAGTPLLLLHGWPETASCWRELAPRLAEGRRVLAPDLPGLGGSTYPGPFDAGSLAAEIAALVAAEVPGGRVDVVGHDWGGVVALALAGHHPELVRRLVVANAPFRSVPARALHIPFFALPVLPDLLFKVAAGKVVDTAFALAWKSDRRLDPESRAEYRAAYGRTAVARAALGYYRAAARPQLLGLVRRAALPAPPPRVAVEAAMVLWGAEDPVLPIATGESVVRDLGADCVMVTVPGAGHFVHEEAPEVVGDVLLDFLADETTPAPPVAAAPPSPPAEEHEVVEAPAGAPVEPAATKAPARRAPAKKAPAKKAPAKKAPAKKKAPPSAG